MYVTYLCTLLYTYVHNCIHISHIFLYLQTSYARGSAGKFSALLLLGLFERLPPSWSGSRSKLLCFDDRSQSRPDICEPLENFTESSSTCRRSKYISQSQSMEICRKDKVKMVHSSSPTGKRSTTCPNCFEAAKGLPATNHLVNTAPWT